MNLKYKRYELEKYRAFAVMCADPKKSSVVLASSRPGGKKQTWALAVGVVAKPGQATGPVRGNRFIATRLFYH